MDQAAGDVQALLHPTPSAFHSFVGALAQADHFQQFLDSCTSFVLRKAIQGGEIGQVIPAR